MTKTEQIYLAFENANNGIINSDIPRGMGDFSSPALPLEFPFTGIDLLEELRPKVLPYQGSTPDNFFALYTAEESLEDYLPLVDIDSPTFGAPLLLEVQSDIPEFSIIPEYDQEFGPNEALLAQLPFSSKKAPTPPDISGALGKRVEKQELKALEIFAMEQITFAVFDHELHAYQPPCWKTLDAHMCTIRLKELFCQHGFDRHLGSSDYKELYRSLLTNPQLQRGTTPDPPPHRLNLLDGTLDIETMEFYDHDPADMFFTCLNLTKDEILDPGDGSTFESFISAASNGDPAVRQQILELTALACTGHQIKAFFVLVGPSGTGKSQFARFLIELLGHEYAASIGGIHELGSKFGMALMEGKSLAVCMDLPNSPLPPTAIGTLKIAVGGDAIKIEAKYKNPKTIYRSPLWLFGSNFPLQIPNVEQEDAFLQRMVMIPFLHAVPPEKQIPQLYKKLLEEAPYIIRESIEAYRNMMANNFLLTRAEIPPEFSPGESREIVTEIQSFLKHSCQHDSNSSVTTERLYQAFIGRSHSGRVQFTTKLAFSKIVAEIFGKDPNVFEVKRAENSERRGYRGIRLLSTDTLTVAT